MIHRPDLVEQDWCGVKGLEQLSLCEAIDLGATLPRVT